MPLMGGPRQYIYLNVIDEVKDNYDFPCVLQHSLDKQI